MRLGKTTLIHFGSQVVLSVAGFVATFVIARLLGASGLGVYSIVVALVFWLNVPTVAVATAVSKRLSEGIDQGTYLSSGYVLNGLIGAGFALVVVLLAGYVNDYVGAEVSWLLAAILLANAAFVTTKSALTGQKRVAASGILGAFERVSRTGVQVALLLIGWQLIGLLVGYATSMFVAAVLGVLLFEVRPSRPTADSLASLGEFARYSWLGTLKSRAFGWMDTIFLAIFVPSALIGIYEASWTLAATLTMVSLSVRQTLFPEMSELGVEGEFDRIHHYLNEGFVFTGVFAIPGLLGAAVLGGRVLKIYSPSFSQGALILVVLIVAQTVSAFGSQFLNAVNAIDRPDVAFRINAAFVGANLLLNAVLIWQFGWYGAAVATTLSAGLSLGLGYVALTRLIGPPDIPVREIGRQILASTVMAAVVYGLTRITPPDNYVTIGLVGVGAVVYTSVLIAISPRVRHKAWALFPGTTPA